MKHYRQNTAVYLKDCLNPLSSRSSSYSSQCSNTHFREEFSGSVYVQACKLCKDENLTSEFDSFFSSSVEVIISEIDKISEGELLDDKSEFNRLMQDITNKKIQVEYLKEASKRKLRNSLLLFVNVKY